ncbi:hypothetical protein [Citrobacter koseri]|uniref:hypothetical protein n=1 Tax=Citrobacter koseri TaxID=545 RepID=UPI00330A3CE4|nr:hypothetical protein [Citrobacter koseri]
MLDSWWALRSRLPELVRQELVDVLLTYNLLRYQMVRMAFHLKGDYLSYQLSNKRHHAATDNAAVGIAGKYAG